MTFASLLALQNQAFQPPSYFIPVTLALLVLGALEWVGAAELGFTRGRDYVPAARWFAAAAVCLVLYHLWFILLALSLVNRPELALGVGAFFNLFVLLGGICAVIGFSRLSK